MAAAFSAGIFRRVGGSENLSVETRMAQSYRSSVLLFAAFLAVGCATGPEYQPRTPGGLVGYTDLQLSPNRYRVAFSGDYATSRDDVEMYLFRRAAEVTLQNGFTHFVIQMRDTERMSDYFGGPYSYGYYYPYGGDNWNLSAYSSYAEILLLNDTEAAQTTEAVDAQRVLVSVNALPDGSRLKTAAAPK
jgi:hypothetical protein